MEIHVICMINITFAIYYGGPRNKTNHKKNRRYKSIREVQ